MEMSEYETVCDVTMVLLQKEFHISTSLLQCQPTGLRPVLRTLEVIKALMRSVPPKYRFRHGNFFRESRTLKWNSDFFFKAFLAVFLA